MYTKSGSPSRRPRAYRLARDARPPTNHGAAGYQDQGLVFARPDGSTFTPWNLGPSFSDLVRRAGVTRIRLHDLRDTHASLLAKAGVAIEVVSKRLGHSNIAITVDRYLVVYRDRAEAAASAFERLVG